MNLQAAAEQAADHQLALGHEASALEAEVAIAHVPVIGDARIVRIVDGLPRPRRR
jgi:hypothetical protein